MTRRFADEKERDPNDRLLRVPDVVERAGISRSQIYDLMTDGRFPEAVKLSKRSVAWWLSDVEAWRRSRPRVGRRAK